MATSSSFEKAFGKRAERIRQKISKATPEERNILGGGGALGERLRKAQERKRKLRESRNN
jgi:hypothetical protein